MALAIYEFNIIVFDFEMQRQAFLPLKKSYCCAKWVRST
jgi:hypothetical protein